MKLRGEPRLCIRCGAPGCSTRFQCKQGFYCGAACRSADQKMRENKKTPSKCENPEPGGWGAEVAGTAGTSPRPSVDDALSKQWQDTKTLVDEMKQLLKLDNSQVAQRSGTLSLNFELWYNKPLECTPAFMDDMTKYLGLWIKKERKCGLQPVLQLQPDDKPRSEGAGESASTKVRKYGKSQRSSKEDAAAQNELLSGSFPKTWEDETALERIRSRQASFQNKQAGIVPLQDNIGTKRSFGELGIPTMHAAVKTSKSFPTSFKHGTPIKKKSPIHYGLSVPLLKAKALKIPLLPQSSGSGSTMKPGPGPPRASESSSKRVEPGAPRLAQSSGSGSTMKPRASHSSSRSAFASGMPRLAQSSGSGSTMKPAPGPPRASESSSKRVDWSYQVKALRSPANMNRLAEAQPSRSDGSGDFRSKEQPKLGLMHDHAVDSVELALHSARESTNELDELDIASILAFCTAAELAEATNQQESEALACMVLGRMPASSQTTAKMRGDTLGKELLRMGRVTRWLSGAIDIVYEVMCEAIRSPEGDLAASLKQVGTFSRPRTAAPQVLVDFAKGLGWNEEGVVVDVTGPS